MAAFGMSQVRLRNARDSYVSRPGTVAMMQQRGMIGGLRSRLPILLGAVVILAAIAFAFGPTVERKVFGKTPPGVTQLSSIDELRTDFNRDAGSTRLVMIFSPT